MNNNMWSFSDFVLWLRVKSEALAASGSVVDFELQSQVRASVRLRVERGDRLGELTVWDNASAHMAVLDLQSGDFMFERDGVSLTGAPIETMLQEFFEILTGDV